MSANHQYDSHEETGNEELPKEDFQLPLSHEDLEKQGGTVQAVDLFQNIAEEEDLSEIVEQLVLFLCDMDAIHVLHEEALNQIYTAVKHFRTLPGTSRSRLVQGLCTNFSILISSVTRMLKTEESLRRLQTVHHRCALKVYMFFLHWIWSQANKETREVGNKPSSEEALPKGSRRNRHSNQKADGWDWEESRRSILSTASMAALLRLDELFLPEKPPEALLLQFSHMGQWAIQDQQLVKSRERREEAFHLLCAVAVKYNQLDGMAAPLVQLLGEHEHLPAIFAEMARFAATNYGETRLASALLTEIAIVPPASYKAQQLTDSKGLRCAANFIEKLAEAMPSVAVAHASIFAPHLGGEAYTLRSAIMTMFGHCIHEGFGEHGDERSRAARVKSKQSLLDTLLQRTRDQNAFTRARTLQTWAFLAQRARIPMSHWLVVAQLAAGRLRDKASAVRKAAMQLLQAMLKYNPFGATLVSERYRATLRDAEARLAQEKSLQDEFQDCTGGEGSAGDAGIAASDMASETQNAEGEADAGCGGESSNGAQDVSGGRFSTEAVPSPGDAEEDHEVSPDDLEGGVGTLPSLIAHLKVAVGFIETIMGAIPAVNQLMSTGSVTDINEAINFITDVYEFKVDGSAAALRSVLPLVFSREESVRKSVVDATALIFLSGREAQESAETMLSLVQGATVGDLAALEEVLRLLLQDGGPMDDSIVWALWGLLSGDGELQASQSALAFAQGTSSSVERRRCAVQLLSMVAKHRPSAVAENLRTLLTVCFDSETPADVILVRCSADCIRSAGRHLYDDRSANSGDVLDAIRALTEIIISEDLPMEHWFSAAESAIGAIYAVHPEPEAMARAIITKLTELAAPQGAGIPDNEAGTESAGSGSVCAHEEQQQGFDHAISSYSDHGLAKLFFVVGQVALEQVIHLDWLAGSARRQVAEAAKASYGAQTSRKEKTQGDMSAELGVGTSLATEDAEIDAMKEAGEKELVCPSSLIGSYVPLLKAVCQSKRLSEGHHVLHSSAILSLAKLMVVSEQLCESNQRLLFSLLCTSTTEPSVRSNIVIACGDLFVRFPNAMEPWTSNLYQALSDSDAGVRKNAIMVITHLILNDMMKVKGHVAAVAVCLEDESKQIRELARLFFHELAGKSFKDSNPVFSLLPDILSNLSANPVVPESKFRKIMEHLFAFVSRDKHMDALVEKMCQRLNATAEPAIWRDIAFCLSKLSFTEKGLRILVDSFRLYRHTLQDAEVSGTIKNILANALKGGGSKKEEVRALLTDFETMFSEYTEECQEGPGAADEESSATGSKENDDTPNGSHIDDGDDAAGQSTVIGPQETECKPGAMMPLHDVEDSSKAGQTSGRDPCFGGLEDVACMNPLDGIPVGKAAEDLKSTDRGVLADLKNVVNH